jgi:hypothetical protein
VFFSHFPQQLARLLCALLLYSAGSVIAQNFTFAAFGDAPYTEAEESRFINVIEAINREPLAFAIHVGDFKSSWTPCTDALFLRRRDELASLHHPLIYTPGDNEWTDCWRTISPSGTSNAERNPVERLQQLRRLFFADGHSLGQRKIALARQSASFPEHARWQHADVLFATVNMPGGNNNARMPDESRAREKMVEAWIADTFRIARVHSHAAVVLAMQANPWSANANVRRGYGSMMATITRETQRFAGEVLLIHGDTHQYRIDQPLIDPLTRQPLHNFTRIEVFGSPFVNWVRITVKQENGRIQFEGAPGS